MKRNSIRVVCNPYSNKMSYYFKNELGEWEVLSGNSPLSRQFYTNTTIAERGDLILKKIDEIYNRKNKGVDILFEGTSESYKCLIDNIKYLLSDRDITYRLGTTKVAVVGKKAVGKTFLIEGLEEIQGFNYSKEKTKEYIKYADECNHAEWYEINGIDLGKDKVETAFNTIKELSNNSLSSVIYCISASTGRIEEIEKNLIKRIADAFAELKIMIVLTMSYKEDIQEAIDEIEKITDQVKIVPVLAKEYKTAIKDENQNSIIIEPFGLEEVAEYVFEGR